MFAFTTINNYENIYNDLQSKSSDEKDKTVLDKYKEQIIALSIENGIPSKFTSFIGVKNDSQQNSILVDKQLNYQNSIHQWNISSSNRFIRMGKFIDFQLLNIIYQTKFYFNAFFNKSSISKFDA